MRPFYRVLDWANHRAKALAVRAHGGIHPKHLSVHQPTDEWIRAHCKPGDYMLDLGCGLGLHSLVAAERGWVARVVGIDRTPPRHNDRPNASYRTGDLEVTLDVPPHHYDIVLALDVIEHLHNRTHFLQECRRVLVPGGKLLITAPNGASAWRKRLGRMQDADHKREYELDEFLWLLDKHGFIVNEWEPITWDTPLAGWIDLSSVVSMRLYERLTRWRVAYAHRHPSETTGWRIVATKTH